MSTVATHAMIDGQLTPQNILDEKILDAFTQVDREEFMPSQYRKVAYLDGSHLVADGRYTLPVMLMARMFEKAEIMPTDNVMIIGCATGYSATICARLAKHVHAVEENQELATMARAIVNKKSIQGLDIVSTPLISGCSEHAPYDAIIIEGGVEMIPEELFSQLADGGRMMFVKHSGTQMTGTQGMGYLTRCVKCEDRYEIEEFEECSAAVLPGFNEPTEFML